MAACEQLYKAGYRNLFWLNGGFDAAQEGVLISVVCLPVIPFCHKVDIIFDTLLSGFFIPPDLGCFMIAMDCQFLWISKQNVHSTNCKSYRRAMGFLHYENIGSVIGAQKIIESAGPTVSCGIDHICCCHTVGWSNLNIIFAGYGYGMKRTWNWKLDQYPY